MSLFIPKPKILYAPMLATFGGGSIGGFKSGGADFEAYDFAVGQSITFRNGDLTIDPNGITLTQARAYLSTTQPDGSSQAYQYSQWGNNTEFFNVWYQNGYQDWLVPQKGRYNICCAGAQGGSATYTVGGMSATNGASGGVVEAKFDLTGGSSLRFICGAKGTTENNEGGAGGGGGSFVFFGSGLTANVTTANYAHNGTDAEKKAACMLAAGGGGSASHSNTQSQRAGQPAYTGAAFGTGRGANSSGYHDAPSAITTLGHGTNGSGGSIDRENNSVGQWSGGAGSGILSAGEDGRSSGGTSGYVTNRHYENGFRGSYNTGNFNYGESGGFGGGARGSYSGAGGGGFSGGAGDWSDGSTSHGHGGGGGGNFINSSFSVSGQGSYVSYSTNANNNTSYGTIVITRDS